MISSCYSCGFCLLKINPTLFSPKTPITHLHLPIIFFNQLPHSTISSHLQPYNNNNKNESPKLFQSTKRKLLNFSMLTVLFSSPICQPFLSLSLAETEDLIELERYTDIDQGFTLLKPASWIKVEKAGATVLFEDPNKGSNNVGVVVTPVRLDGLRQFGDPQFVSNKLIQAEKRKESTKDVQIVSFRERPDQKGDIQVYEFEYKLDSTRGGLKTIFSAAFVASKKLYLLNIAHSDNPEQPLSDNKRIMLEQVLHSFDVAPPSATTDTQV
ncbi:psbP domain-containing protein 2, chloroplastic [Rutidosis leptorrhynchoides]|uniref:psbP domain-containing protein 2, chloroplastic n=1 Tax=Rutidosis leptorrhynchoides TaxID=125765 RepID=UPI003A990C20